MGWCHVGYDQMIPIGYTGLEQAEKEYQGQFAYEIAIKQCVCVSVCKRALEFIIIIYFDSGSMAHQHKTQRTEDRQECTEYTDDISYVVRIVR